CFRIRAWIWRRWHNAQVSGRRVICGASGENTNLRRPRTAAHARLRLDLQLLINLGNDLPVAVDFDQRQIVAWNTSEIISTSRKLACLSTQQAVMNRTSGHHVTTIFTIYCQPVSLDLWAGWQTVTSCGLYG